MKIHSLFTIALPFLLLLAGCTQSLALKENIIDLNPEIPKNIIINNMKTGGDIAIYFYEKRIIPEIRWKARRMNFWSEQGEVGLEKISCEVTQNKNQLKITPTTTSKNSKMQRTDLVILLPSGVHLHIKNRNGDVFIRNFNQSLHAETSHGSIVAKTKYPINKKIQLLNSNGDVILRSAPGSRGILDLETINGNTKANLRSGSVYIKPESTNKKLKGRLGNGNNLILLRSAHGVARIDVVENPLEGHGEIKIPLLLQ